MPNSRLFRAVLVVALIVATSPLAGAAEIIVNLAPPAPVVETAPPTPVAPGYWAWRPGFWRWNGRQYVWIRGWVWIPGHWRRA